MTNSNELHLKAMELLKRTSRTFYIPISILSPGLKESVAAAYLCMRAIDEIEDHPELSTQAKTSLLASVQEQLLRQPSECSCQAIFAPYQTVLHEVTLALDEWIAYCPTSIRSTVVSTTAAMSARMGYWVEQGWKVASKEDLDSYTFDVAGRVGLLLSEIWNIHEGLITDTKLAVAFGRGLQAVNIIRNRDEDAARGVDYFPTHWDLEDMIAYARQHLMLGQQYLKDIHEGPILTFCKLPLLFAFRTLSTIENGQSKLSRSTVQDLTQQVLAEDTDWVIHTSAFQYLQT